MLLTDSPVPWCRLSLNFEGQEGTLWWHAHSSWIRATVYGAIIIHPKEGYSYPFPKPNNESVIALDMQFIYVFITAISVYYITMEEIYLYMPLSGSGGALSGLLVGVIKITPDQELSPLKIKAKWLPSIVLFLSIGISLFTVEPATCLPILLFGTYTGWIYLRYFQRKQETKVQGDPSDEFAFSTFFPEIIRPMIDSISSIFHQMLLGRSEVSIETRGYTVGTASLPGSDSIEASRRRERGARALEERLAAERLASVGRTAEPNRIATEKVSGQALSWWNYPLRRQC